MVCQCFANVFCEIEIEIEVNWASVIIKLYINAIWLGEALAKDDNGVSCIGLTDHWL